MTADTLLQNQQVAEYWSDVAEKGELGFWNVPGWFEHQNRMASGDPKKTWLSVLNHYIRSQQAEPSHALSLGCGGGSLEIQMMEEGLCKTVEGCDISPGLLKMAAETAKARKMPIEYFVADLNRPQFESGRYDLIIGAGIFHHVENLEGLFANLRTALKPNGFLLLYDYVGPTRFQWTPAQIERCNFWLKQLPKRFKRKQGYPKYYYFGKAFFDAIPFVHSKNVETWLKTSLSSRLYAQFVRLKTAQIQMNEVRAPHPDQFLVTDPSEAVRSSEILSVLKKHFNVELLIPQGGTLVQPLFGRTSANFINDPEADFWVRQILEDERVAIERKELPSDFVALVAK